jgi:carboxyl-terminal processing protease
MKRVLKSALVPALLLLASFVAWAQPITADEKKQIVDELNKIVMERAFVPGVDFSKWPEFIEKQQESIDKAEDQNAFAGAVNRALRNFGITHIGLRTPRASEARRTTSTIGIGIQAQKVEEGLVVRMAFPESPAAAAGIKEGEVIIEVDGKAPDSPMVLNGDEGTSVMVKIKDADGNIRELKLERKRYSSVRPETLTWKDDETAVLKIWTFANGYNRQNVSKLVQEASGKAKYLVLDLRNNGGGAVANLRHLLSMLLPDNTVIGTFISRSTVTQYKEKNGVEISDPVELAKFSEAKFRTSPVKLDGKEIRFTGKVAVLINRGSGSASEIAAAALRENANAPLLGAKSAGAVLASVYGQLPLKFEVQYPVQDYVTAKLMRLEKNPLVPDIEVEQPRGASEDEAIAKAVELLKK